MTDLVALHRLKKEAEERYRAISQCNSYGLTDEQRVAMDLAYTQAQERWLQLTHQYNEALRAQVKKGLANEV